MSNIAGLDDGDDDDDSNEPEDYAAGAAAAVSASAEGPLLLRRLSSGASTPRSHVSLSSASSRGVAASNPGAGSAGTAASTALAKGGGGAAAYVSGASGIGGSSRPSSRVASVYADGASRPSSPDGRPKRERGTSSRSLGGSRSITPAASSSSLTPVPSPFSIKRLSSAENSVAAASALITPQPQLSLETGSGAALPSTAPSRTPRTARQVARHRWREGIFAVIAVNRFAQGGESSRLRKESAKIEERRRRILSDRKPARDRFLRRSVSSKGDPGWESPAQILPYLYIGGRDDAEDLPKLLSMGITHVLNAAASLDKVHEEHFVYLKCELDDDDDEDIAGAFAPAFAQIADARAGKGSVLVHCVAGMSRSVSLAIAWLVYAEGMSLKRALDLVRSKRPIALPNAGFRLALARYEVQLYGASSVVGLRSDPAWNFTEWTAESSRYRRRPDTGPWRPQGDGADGEGSPIGEEMEELIEGGSGCCAVS